MISVKWWNCIEYARIGMFMIVWAIFSDCAKSFSDWIMREWIEWDRMTGREQQKRYWNSTCWSLILKRMELRLVNPWTTRCFWTKKYKRVFLTNHSRTICTNRLTNHFHLPTVDWSLAKHYRYRSDTLQKDQIEETQIAWDWGYPLLNKNREVSKHRWNPWRKVATHRTFL